jgi:hypothetical protein
MENVAVVIFNISERRTLALNVKHMLMLPPHIQPKTKNLTEVHMTSASRKVEVTPVKHTHADS